VEQTLTASRPVLPLMGVWAVGISADRNANFRRVDSPGYPALPVRQFQAHMDRTLLWWVPSSVSALVVSRLREFAVFTPPYVDRLLDENETLKIREIHRSWKHTVIVTD
jgi:hypothetical protein